MLAFVHYKNTPNIGDLSCAPYLYFNFKDYKAFNVGDDIPAVEAVIYGGGAIEPELRRRGIHRQVLAETKIGWGIGTSRRGQTEHGPLVDDLDLCGVREYGREGANSRTLYVPCVSSMSVHFDNAPKPQHDVVFYTHGHFNLKAPDSVPSLNNRASTLEEAIRFIGAGDTVVTNSFHGTYWALLLGRKVVCIPFSSKFYGFASPPQYCTDGDWQTAARRAVRYSGYLEECRELNKVFAQRVGSLLSTRRRLTRRILKVQQALPVLSAPTVKTSDPTELVVAKPKLSKAENHTYLSAHFSSPKGSGEFWLRSSDQAVVEQFDTSKSDAFMLPALIMGMNHGLDIRLGTPVSDILLQNAVGPLQKLLHIRKPSSSIVKVQAEPGTFQAKKSLGVGTGLSCGIDSLAAVYTHYLAPSSPSVALTHLCQYSHQQKRGEENRWARDMHRFEALAGELGLPLLKVGTNFSPVLGQPHTMVHSLLNSSAALALDGLLGTYYYASGFQFRDVAVGPTKDIAQSDPITLPMISNHSIRFASTGGDMPRTRKTELVAQIPLSERYLEVCTKSPPGKLNCSACYKCLRTMATLDLLGALPRYGQVFNLALYRQQRPAYARKLLATTNNAQMNEVKELPGAQDVLTMWANPRAHSSA